jgi:hypothetical protein
VFQCLPEIVLYKHLQLRCADVFDRLEYLGRVSLGWYSPMNKGNVPADLLEPLPLFWTRPFAEIRRSMTALLAAIDAKTEVWLTHLDNVNEESPQWLSLFGQMLDSYESALDPITDVLQPAVAAARVPFQKRRPTK